MNKDFWKELASQSPIVALAPMDGYTDSPYRQLVKSIAPDVITFSEFYSADGIVRSKTLAPEALIHHPSEKPLIIQIFGKDPEMFRQAAIIIESYGIAGIDINMGCPAKKVVKSGHGSSLMINRDTAFKIVEEMAKAVSIPVSVKTRLGWENDEYLIDFCKGLENAGANLITVHGRTYKQAFTGKADFSGIYDLKQALGIPVLANGDILDCEDGLRKMLHPANRTENIFSRDADLRSRYSIATDASEADSGRGAGIPSWDRFPLSKEGISGATSAHASDLDGFMIGRSSFGNPWSFLPGSYRPSLKEILDVMERHASLLIEHKWRKWALEARKHLVQYLHGFPGVKTYRSGLIHVENIEDVRGILNTIRSDHSTSLDLVPTDDSRGSILESWTEEENCPVG